MSLNVKIEKNESSNIIALLDGCEYEAIEVKSSDGDISSILIVVSLASVTIKQLSNILIALIKSKGRKSIKVKGYEITGYSLEDALKLIESIKAKK